MIIHSLISNTMSQIKKLRNQEKTSLTFLIVRKGRGGDGLAGDSYANAAFDQPMGGLAAADPSITPEQLQYEQQLLAHGYTAEQARAYADQHFRPWLNQ